MKNNKTNKSTRNVAAVTKTPRTSVDYTTRFNSAKGRFVGVMTINSRNKVQKFNGRVTSQSSQYVNIFDNNQKRNVRISKSNIIGVSGV